MLLQIVLSCGMGNFTQRAPTGWFWLQSRRLLILSLLSYVLALYFVYYIYFYLCQIDLQPIRDFFREDKIAYPTWIILTSVFIQIFSSGHFVFNHIIFFIYLHIFLFFAQLKMFRHYLTQIKFNKNDIFVNLGLTFLHRECQTELTVCQKVEISQWVRAALGHGIWLLVHPSQSQTIEIRFIILAPQKLLAS